MPRKQETKATDVLNFFETAPLDAAALVADLAVAAIKRRKGKVAPAATMDGSTAAPRTRNRNRTTTPAASAPPLPMAPVTGGGAQA